MRLIQLFTLLFTCVVLHGKNRETTYLGVEYDPDKWPKATLKFSQVGTLKNLFEAGLRPYRFPGLETSSLGLKHVRLEILLSSGKKLPAYTVEHSNISVYGDGGIATATFYSRPVTLEEAKRVIANWRETTFLQNGVSKSLSRDLLFKGLSEKNTQYEIKRFPVIGWREPGWKTREGGPACSLSVYRGPNPTINERFRFMLHFSWSRNRGIKKGGSYYNIPIPPPPGYEAVSMDAPENFGPDNLAYITQKKEEELKKKQNEIKLEPKSEATPMWLWILVLAVSSLILSALVFKRKS